MPPRGHNGRAGVEAHFVVGDEWQVRKSARQNIQPPLHLVECESNNALLAFPEQNSLRKAPRQHGDLQSMSGNHIGVLGNHCKCLDV